MSDGPESLTPLIERLRELGTLPEQAAPRVAEAMLQEVTRTIAAGTAPDGTPWAPTKAGERPLRGAAKALSASASGTVALLTLSGPEVLHHEGRAKGGVRRQILPSRKLNAPIVRALKRIIAEETQRILRGDG